MTDQIKGAIDAAASLSAAISGPDTPDSVKVSQRDDALTVWMRNLAGPAISLMLGGVIGILTWGVKVGVWTSLSEVERATSVGAIGVALCLILGVALWICLVGRPSRLEMTAGPASLKIGNEPQE